jgi:hypothetical protein
MGGDRGLPVIRLIDLRDRFPLESSLRSQFSDGYKRLLTYQKLIADDWQLITASSCSERYTACHCDDAVSRKRLGGCRIAARTALPLRACPGVEP